jgi:hypothetical protein
MLIWLCCWSWRPPPPWAVPAPPGSYCHHGSPCNFGYDLDTDFLNRCLRRICGFGSLIGYEKYVVLRQSYVAQHKQYIPCPTSLCGRQHTHATLCVCCLLACCMCWDSWVDASPLADQLDSENIFSHFLLLLTLPIWHYFSVYSSLFVLQIT